MNAQLIVRSMRSWWDKPACIKWYEVTFTDGSKVQVGVPLAQVVATFDAHAAEVGLAIEPFVGDVESVDGLFSSITKAVKSVGKGVGKVVSKTAKTIDSGVKATAKVVRGKTLTAVMSVGKFVPVVGPAAYAAHKAAVQAADTYDKAKSTANAVYRTGRSSVQAAQSIARGRNVAQSINQLRKNANSPEARMALSALRSVA
jgi:hypothetical protein